jgi:hypothetical protein
MACFTADPPRRCMTLPDEVRRPNALASLQQIAVDVLMIMTRVGGNRERARYRERDTTNSGLFTVTELQLNLAGIELYAVTVDPFPVLFFKTLWLACSLQFNKLCMVLAHLHFYSSRALLVLKTVFQAS